MSINFPIVTMVRAGNGEWEVMSPDANKVDVTESKTSGLQEAINYAAEHGLGLRVAGGIYDHPPKIAQNLIVCTETIHIPPLSNAYWSIEGVAIHFKPITGDGFLFDSIVHSRLTFDCAIHYRGSGAAMHVSPRNPYPRGEQAMFIDNEIRVGRLRVREGDNPVGLRLSGPNSIYRNRFDLIEVEGDILDGIPVMSRGIHVAGNFSSNWFTVQALLAPGVCGIDVEGATANRFEAHIEPCGAVARGVRTSGSFGHYVLDIADGSAPYGVGIELAEGAADNSFIVQRNRGLMPVVDNAPQGRNRFL